MNKSALRKKYLSQRIELSDERHGQLNTQLISIFFKSLDLSAIKYLHIFLPIAKFKEVDTWQIIDQIERCFPTIKLVVPKVIDVRIEHYLYETKDQLAIDKWDIPEPKHGTLISPNQIDLVLVPLVVADRYGNRIGYGKGFYDKFLAECKGPTQKIGLSLLPLLEEKIDSEATDVKLDGCITPTSFRSFS